jgi:hypothetical protein
MNRITPNSSIIANMRRQGYFSNANYSRQLLKVIGRVEGLFPSDEEVRKLIMPDREAWQSRIIMILAENKKVNYSKRERSKKR